MIRETDGRVFLLLHARNDAAGRPSSFNLGALGNMPPSMNRGRLYSAPHATPPDTGGRSPHDPMLDSLRLNRHPTTTTIFGVKSGAAVRLIARVAARCRQVASGKLVCQLRVVPPVALQLPPQSTRKRCGRRFAGSSQLAAWHPSWSTREWSRMRTAVVSAISAHGPPIRPGPTHRNSPRPTFGRCNPEPP